MILVKKTALLSPRGAHGTCGVARFECFKEKSDVKISLSGGRKDLYAVVAVGDETRVVKLGADRIYLARTDLSGDCAVLVTDGEKRVICAGATACGYDFSKLEKFLPEAFGETASEDKKEIIEKEENSAALGNAPSEDKADVVSVVNEQQMVSETSETIAPETAVAVEEAKEEQKTAKTEDNKLSETENVHADKAKEKKGRFFDKIAEKIDKLFKDNPADGELTALIPDSRWARVRTEDGWYVVGTVGEPAEFICYGIPADNALDPPDEEEGCRQWLEVEKGGRGYWMMYQSAESGETLTAI